MSSLKDSVISFQKNTGEIVEEHFEKLKSQVDNKILDINNSKVSQTGTIVRYKSKESIYSSCDFLDLESLSENGTNLGELNKGTKEAKLVSNCSSNLDEYLDTCSKSIISRNSSLLSVESITFEENSECALQEYRKNCVKSIDSAELDDLSSMNVKVCRENEIFNDNLNRKFSGDQDPTKPGFLSKLSTKFWNFEESLSLSKFDSISGIKTFLLGKTGYQNTFGSEQNTPNYVFSGPELEDGHVFFANSRDGYDSQRSESDTSEESVRYPLINFDTIN
ncbi:uncharacterized protein cubi_00804 [Cryptosporidium ubiquitum]|uniref:Uncharacterized protein n=1 Tax=Cryptosporidium ubiquitum TaxID=857276 RepID=A0A1J4MB19_9CRYT|nr:uncharacterized protein cubi_00804 [Cryptosporidium ubiquitum]OII71426.1 hypothetical protein cubi_00804 [Cryptosporidium ubiquitum]